MSEEPRNGNGKPMPAYIAGRLNLDDLGSSRRVLCVLADSGPTTQQAAGQQLGLTAGTCNLHFQRLEHDGLIYRVRHQRGGRGRPTVIWDIDTEHNFCVSLVFGVPYLEASLTNFRGDVIHQHGEDLTGVEGQGHIREVIDRFMTTATERVAELGGWMRQAFVAVPGILDPETGAVEKAVNLPSLNGYDAREHIEGTHKVPCFAGSLGLACYYGETESVPPDITTMVIYWDLGVGVVFGCQHQILSLDSPAEGSRRLLSELGHVRVVRGGRPCHCGNRGCLEAYTGRLYCRSWHAGTFGAWPTWCSTRGTTTVRCWTRRPRRRADWGAT
jgi:predicted NBD/HSP70 family sugar kinase